MSLDSYIDNYIGDKADVEERFMTRGTLRICAPYVKDKTVLQMGLGNGFIAKALDSEVRSQVVVEGSKRIIDEYGFQTSRTSIVHGLFEDYTPTARYDIVLANHVLEHVDNPVSILIYVKSWLNPNGKVVVTVPNAESIHRQIGKSMGMLNTIYDLNKSDHAAGHQRVYDSASLKLDIEQAGFRIVEFGGYNLKMVSLKQMSDWSQDLLNAVFDVSRNMNAEVCANLWAMVEVK